MLSHTDVLAVILITATIQSLFGVGVLLFGTPLLLILGYEFTSALSILLPISLSINLLQAITHANQIGWSFYRKILTLTIPGIILFLFLVTHTTVNIGIIVGLFLVGVAAKTAMPGVNRFIKSLTRHERIYFLVMGIVHGLTNLGGSLLTALIHSKHHEKNAARATIAISYGTFAAFQLFTLFFSLERLPIAFPEVLTYVVTGILVFLVTEQMMYVRMNEERYRTIFAVFLLISGLMLLLKSALPRFG